ncbi:hypothetical protein SLH49_07075 [Cognatiyoonia sp. IB215446]|uniref:hypothetical protein n=1 Tax=Cognatiyoonia sp. IB215446 TaxID=3097355 RepID=UPI002A12D584|nr:hypothetical protein [Cognatiyoonia sp. IB215446]MDX8347744.1 hypothetical protein [Cognatiyoonia sp. IB215446]
MRYAMMSVLVLLIGCDDSNSAEARSAALQSAANQPVPVFQSSSEAVNERDSILYARLTIPDYLDNPRTQVVGTQPSVPFVASGLYGDLYRIDGKSGSISVFDLADNFLSNIGPVTPERAGEMSPAIAARAGCSWSGDAAVRSNGTDIQVISFLDC